MRLWPDGRSTPLRHLPILSRDDLAPPLVARYRGLSKQLHCMRREELFDELRQCLTSIDCIQRHVQAHTAVVCPHESGRAIAPEVRFLAARRTHSDGHQPKVTTGSFLASNLVEPSVNAHRLPAASKERFKPIGYRVRGAAAKETRHMKVLFTEGDDRAAPAPMPASVSRH